jgi:hypothetical protein
VDATQGESYTDGSPTESKPRGCLCTVAQGAFGRCANRLTCRSVACDQELPHASAGAPADGLVAQVYLRWLPRSSSSGSECFGGGTLRFSPGGDAGGLAPTGGGVGASVGGLVPAGPAGGDLPLDGGVTPGTPGTATPGPFASGRAGLPWPASTEDAEPDRVGAMGGAGLGGLGLTVGASVRRPTSTAVAGLDCWASRGCAGPC